MIWRKSFFKITLHDMKKRSWCMALLFVVQFFAVPISALLSIQNYQGMYLEGDRNLLTQYQSVIGELFERNVFDFGKNGSVLFLIAGAVLMAMTGFSYLNSKKKVDFIHSMPVKREALFLSRYLAGFLLYIVPLIVNAGIGLVAALMTKGCSSYVIKSALCFLLYHMIYFLLFYSTAILAIVLIGNLVVSFLGIGILFTYQTVMWFIVVNLKENFYQTYMRIYQTFQVYDPIGLLIRQIMSFNTSYFTYDYNGNRLRIGTESYYSTGWEVCLTAFVLAVVIGAAALLLFRIRKSESAGKTIVFPKAEPVAKAVLLLPAGIIGGLVLYRIATGYQKLWYSFGAVVFFLLAALIIEIIFRQDFKSMLKHKISALAGGGLILIFTLCFWMDLLGFDSRIPKTSQIESVGISIPGVENQTVFFDYDEGAGGSYDMYGSYRNFRLSSYFVSEDARNRNNGILYNCRITGEAEIEKVRALAGYFAKNKGKFKKMNLTEYYDPVKMWRKDEGEEKEESVSSVECQVVYRLKNGKSVYRSYRIPYGEEFLEVIEPVFANEEYKKASEPIFQDEKNYRYLLTRGNFTEKRISIARSSQKEILDCLAKDRDNMTFQGVWTQNRRGYFTLWNNLGSVSSGECYVYEGYTNTLNWLKEHGAGLETEPGDVKILSGKILYMGGDVSYREIQLESAEEKEELVPYLIRSEFVAPGGEINVVTDMTAVIEYTIEQENSQADQDDYDMPAEDYHEMDTFYLQGVPSFVKEQLD